MTKDKKIAFIFPGQGAQFPGMGKDFVNNFSAARLTFEEADEILGRRLSDIILNGPESELTQTENSQTGIYVTSMAILRVLLEINGLKPEVCAGLSLGEYTALTAAEMLDFIHCLPLIQTRAKLMNQACEATPGTMAVVIGLNGDVVEQIVKEINLPKDLWVANINCPGQVVISGTAKGVEAGTEAVKAKGAKMVLPLRVQGAFHSGLMQSAEKKLAEPIQRAPFKKGSAKLVMNVPGNFVEESQIQTNLVKQVTHPVRWEQGIRAIEQSGIELFVEFGPGKTLSGMNKRICPQIPTVSVETVDELDALIKRF